MSFVTLAVIGGTAAVGYLGSQKAAKAQSKAAGKAGDISERQYEQNREDLEPWRTSGGAANARLMELLGLATPQTRASATGSVAPTREQFTKTIAATPGASLGWDRGGERFAIGKPASSSFDQTGYDKALAGYKTATNAASVTPEGFGSLLQPFTGKDLTSEPGYQFELGEGNKAIDRAASAAGRFDSGATLKALTRFGNDYAGTKYGEAFNRDAANKSRTYGFLSGVSGTGANAAGQTAGLGANAANAQGGYATNAGDASAAGYVGGANAITGGVGNYLQYQNNQDVLKYLRKGSIGTGWGGAGAAPY